MPKKSQLNSEPKSFTDVSRIHAVINRRHILEMLPWWTSIIIHFEGEWAHDLRNWKTWRNKSRKSAVCCHPSAFVFPGLWEASCHLAQICFLRCAPSLFYAHPYSMKHPLIYLQGKVLPWSPRCFRTPERGHSRGMVQSRQRWALHW